MRYSLLLILITALLSGNLTSQEFSVEEYKKYRELSSELNTESFYDLYPPGLYSFGAGSDNSILYLDSAIERFNLTTDEIELVRKHDFMVTERLEHYSAWDAFAQIYDYDIPLFISTDIFLHSFHMSYSAILQNLEEVFAEYHLIESLNNYYHYYDVLAEKYSDNEEMQKSLDYYDAYFTVACNLANETIVENGYKTNNPKNEAKVNQILNYIYAEKPQPVDLFGRYLEIDFSQFTLRGHYRRNSNLYGYFKSMMWLGRIHFELGKKMEGETPELLKNHRIVSAMINEASLNTKAGELIDVMDKLILAFVGESDNVKVNQFKEVLDEAGINSPADFLYEEKNDIFIEILSGKSFAGEKIISRIICSDPNNPENGGAPSVFKLFGQRYIIDSHILSNVVYDRINYKGSKVMRMFPNCYDVLFALGNNAAGDFLESEFEQYPYYQNLASMRYLIDSYGVDYWKESLYTSWLNMIRQLNPPDDDTRSNLPDFMKTAAWWQQKMNTQLAGWAQLRHDNLLYAKPSYTMDICSYPHVYLEPEPDFFRAYTTMAKNTVGLLESNLIANADDEKIAKLIGSMKQRIIDYFNTIAEIGQKMEAIAERELLGTTTKEDIEYLCSIFTTKTTPEGCTTTIHPSSWFSRMFYMGPSDAKKPDYIVADIHTEPNSRSVWHVGTGNFNLALIVAKNENGQKTAFMGPVMSYHETWQANFKRLNDEEWGWELLHPMHEPVISRERPDFTYLYLANKDGVNDFVNPPILPVDPTGVETYPVESANIRTNAYPNPASDRVYISLNASNSDITRAEFTIYDIDGRPVATLYEGPAGNGSYTVEWDTRDASGKLVRPGVYVYQVKAGDALYQGKVVVER